MEHTPRNFALQLGALAALYASLASLITLLFGVVTLALPDAAEGYWEATSASEGIRFAFASLIIFFPAYLVLTRYVNVIRRTATDGAYLSLTRWLIYLSLFVGGAIVLGDAVAVVYSWLNGELTLRFFLKAAILGAVIKLAFMYYLLDAKGYWQIHERYSIYCGVAVTVVVVASLVLGFMYMETPAEVRERRIDQQQLTDLQDMQWRVQDYLLTNNELPATIDEVYTVNAAPKASAGRAAYRYKVTETGFKLCASFSAASERNEYLYARPYMPTDTPTPYIENPDNWEHAAGQWCFARKIVQPNE